MQEIKKPSKKPLVYYYLLTLAILLLLNATLFPSMNKSRIENVTYDVFMSMTDEKQIDQVEIRDDQILFTDKDGKIYETVATEDAGRTQRLYDSGAKFQQIDTQPSAMTSLLVNWILPLVPFMLIGYLLNRRMQKAMGGKDGMMLKCHKKLSKGGDIGFVGEVDEVDPQVIYDLLEKDFLPIICPIGYDENFLSYNINADDAACAIARAVKAEKLAFLTDVEGVYKDFEDKSSLISEMTVEEAQAFVDSGSLGGGMLPKLQNCIDAIENGVSRVHILDGRIPHCLLLEIFTDKGIGTAIYNSKEDVRYYHG